MLRQKVRLAILCALAAGVIAFVALAALQYPVSTFFALTDEVGATAVPTELCLPTAGTLIMCVCCFCTREVYSIVHA